MYSQLPVSSRLTSAVVTKTSRILGRSGSLVLVVWGSGLSSGEVSLTRLALRRFRVLQSSMCVLVWMPSGAGPGPSEAVTSALGGLLEENEEGQRGLVYLVERTGAFSSTSRSAMPAIRRVPERPYPTRTFWTLAASCDWIGQALAWDTPAVTELRLSLTSARREWEAGRVLRPGHHLA